VLLKEPGCRTRVPPPDRLHDLSVLGDQVRALRVEGLQRDHAQPGFRRECVEHPGQTHAAGATDQDRVQVQIKIRQIIPVVHWCGLELAERGGKLAEGLGCFRLHQKLCGGRFYGTPGQVQVGDVASSELRDEDTAGWMGFEQTLLDEALERLPHRAPADAELAGDLDLAQRTTRREPAGDDPGPQPCGDPLWRRIAAQRLKQVARAHLQLTTLMGQMRGRGHRIGGLRTGSLFMSGARSSNC
jgi:hypothetical protein